MKVAKNMDSVFANCTQDELDFDILLADDDSIIDFIAGVDEAGIPLTGPDYDYSRILEEAENMLEDPDDEKEREGKVAHHTAPEGSKEVDLEIGGEVGDGKEVSGKEKSSESEAHDMIKLGSETAKQTAVQKAMEIAAKKFADKECCKENSEYEGYTELVEAVVNGIMSDEEIMAESANEMAIATADYLIKECEDKAAREGKVDPENKGNVEGVKSEVIDNQTKGSANNDPIADDCDKAARDGKVAPDKNVEGVANRIMGAAMESGDIHKDIEDQTLDAGVESMNKDIVPDTVKANIDSNKIGPDVENTQEAATHEEHVEDANKDLVGSMKDDLEKLALADALDESVINIAESINNYAHENNVSFSECEGYDNIIEAVIAVMNEDQINMENATEFVIESSDFIIQEFKKVKEKKKAEKLAKLAKRAAQSAADKAKFSKADNKANELMVVGKNELSKIRKNELATKAEKFIDKKGFENKIAKGAEKSAEWVKNNPGKTALGAAAVATGAAGATLAAKKIADKKKAAAKAKEEVKENYEYEEYNTLIECVIDSLTEEEIMSENASELAFNVADHLIEEFSAPAVIPEKDKLKEITKTTLGAKVKDAVKKHPVASAVVGAAGVTGAAGATLAAKKIADKKKAAKQNEEEVKENYEYEEYDTLIECVVESFNIEEILAEDASDMAIDIADILIEKAMDAEDLITNDDDDADIEAIAANNDPDVDLKYGYDDDELIDMVANDTAL